MAKIYSDKLTSSFTSFLQYGNNRGKNPLGNDLLINFESKSTHSNNFEKLKSESESFYHYQKHLWLGAKQFIALKKKRCGYKPSKLRQLALGTSMGYISKFYLSQTSASFSSHHKKCYIWHKGLVNMILLYRYFMAKVSKNLCRLRRG